MVCLSGGGVAVGGRGTKERIKIGPRWHRTATIPQTSVPPSPTQIYHSSFYSSSIYIMQHVNTVRYTYVELSSYEVDIACGTGGCSVPYLT